MQNVYQQMKEEGMKSSEKVEKDVGLVLCSVLAPFTTVSLPFGCALS